MFTDKLTVTIGVVLAGGLSSRMGRDKSTLPALNGTGDLLENARKLLQKTGVSQILISSNNREQAIKDEVGNLGPVGGMHAVFNSLRSHLAKPSGVLFLAVDMPDLNPAILQKLITVGQSEGRPCCYQGAYLPLYLPFTQSSIDYLEAVVSGEHPCSVKALMSGLRGKQIEPLNPSFLINLNSPEDWQRYQSPGLNKVSAGSVMTAIHTDSKQPAVQQRLNIAVLTVSDTRNEDNDTSGGFLAQAIAEQGHNLVEKRIVKDDKYQLRATVSGWIASEDVQVVLVTGGTGFTLRDTTPEALNVLFDKPIEGFGELFRHISYLEIGTSTVQSRAVGGMANGTAIFCMPGSTGACKTAWNGILKQQLDSTHKPCNFVVHLKSGPNEPCQTRG